MSKMHTSPIGNRWQPLLIVSILKDATGPMTEQEIYDEIRNRGHQKFSPSMIGACFAELRADKGGEGYAVSPARRFSDGYYRYWLIAAPGWTPLWQTAYSGTQPAPASARAETAAAPAPYAGGICHNPPCGNPIPEARGKDGCLTCSDECGDAWRKTQRPKFMIDQPQGTLL